MAGVSRALNKLEKALGSSASTSSSKPPRQISAPIALQQSAGVPNAVRVSQLVTTLQLGEPEEYSLIGDVCAEIQLPNKQPQTVAASAAALCAISVVGTTLPDLPSLLVHKSASDPRVEHVAHDHVSMLRLLKHVGIERVTVCAAPTDFTPRPKQVIESSAVSKMKGLIDTAKEQTRTFLGSYDSDQTLLQYRSSVQSLTLLSILSPEDPVTTAYQESHIDTVVTELAIKQHGLRLRDLVFLELKAFAAAAIRSIQAVTLSGKQRPHSSSSSSMASDREPDTAASLQAVLAQTFGTARHIDLDAVPLLTGVIYAPAAIHNDGTRVEHRILVKHQVSNLPPQSKPVGNFNSSWLFGHSQCLVLLRPKLSASVKNSLPRCNCAATPRGGKAMSVCSEWTCLNLVLIGVVISSQQFSKEALQFLEQGYRSKGLSATGIEQQRLGQWSDISISAVLPVLYDERLKAFAGGVGNCYDIIPVCDLLPYMRQFQAALGLADTATEKKQSRPAVRTELVGRVVANIPSGAVRASDPNPMVNGNAQASSTSSSSPPAALPASLGSRCDGLDMNRSQREAVHHFLRMKEQRLGGFHLVQGPPGTGKTNLLSHVVLLLCLEAGSRTVVTASKNHTVRFLLSRFRELMSEENIKRAVLYVGAQRGVSAVPDEEGSTFQRYAIDGWVKYRFDLAGRLQRHLWQVCAVRRRQLQGGLAGMSYSLLSANETVGLSSVPGILVEFVELQQEMAAFGLPLWSNDCQVTQLIQAEFTKQVQGATVDQILQRVSNDCEDAATWPPNEVRDRTRLQRIYAEAVCLSLHVDNWRSQLGALVDRDDIWRVLLNRSEVIFTTFSVCGRAMFRQLTQRKGGSSIPGVVSRVDNLIVDEAAQSSETELLVPIMSCAPTRVMLTGDPEQLEAMLHSNAAKRRGLATSTLGALIGLKRNQPFSLLDVQYRMHPLLSAWPTRAIYGGRLRDGNDLLLREFHRSDPPEIDLNVLVQQHLCTELDRALAVRFHRALKSAMIFVDVPNGVEEVSAGGSRSNAAEMVAVQEVAQQLRSIYPSSGIHVLTFYRSQEQKLRSCLKSHQATATVEVSTVDGFQGDQSDIIILSSVCSNQDANLGFLNDFRRLNVSVTRARHLFVIVGHWRTLSSPKAANNLSVGGGLFRDFMEHVALHTQKHQSKFSAAEIHHLATCPSDLTLAFTQQPVTQYSLPSNEQTGLPQTTLDMYEIMARDFKIQEQIGVGGQAVVHRAILLTSSEIVAVKMPKLNNYSGQLSNSQGQLSNDTRWQTELSIMRSITHPNVVKLLYFCQEPGHLAMVMPLAESDMGKYCAMLHKNQAWSLPVFLSFVQNMVDGMNHLHSRSPHIVHGDVKINNFLVFKDASGQPVGQVADFGLAVLREELSRLTTAFPQAGANCFTAPESFAGKKHTRKSDIYCMALCFVVMWTNAPVWGHGPEKQAYPFLFAKMSLASPAHHPPIPSDLPLFFRALLYWCLSKDPVERPTAQHILEYMRMHRDVGAGGSSSAPSADSSSASAASSSASSSSATSSAAGAGYMDRTKFSTTIDQLDQYITELQQESKGLLVLELQQRRRSNDSSFDGEQYSQKVTAIQRRIATFTQWRNQLEAAKRRSEGVAPVTCALDLEANIDHIYIRLHEIEYQDLAAVRAKIVTLLLSQPPVQAGRDADHDYLSRIALMAARPNHSKPDSPAAADEMGGLIRVEAQLQAEISVLRAHVARIKAEAKAGVNELLGDTPDLR